MSDKPHNDNLLVDQNDALEFYFDSMLLSEDNDSAAEDSDLLSEDIDEKQTIVKQVTQGDDVNKQRFQENKEQADPLKQLQSAKNFLQVSKQRQKNKAVQLINNVPQSENLSELKTQPKAVQPPKAESPVAERAKVITKGPVSPKPRKSEFASADIVSKKMPATQAIIFANKNDDGKVSEQVLIPRSQRLASSKQTSYSKSNSEAQTKTENITLAKTISTDRKTAVNTVPPNHDSTAVKTNFLETNNSASQAMPLENESTPKTGNMAHTQEAPNLDLSLFLPKIKTLSDSEIAQQIEALTQAQLESVPLHSVQAEQTNQQIITKTTQTEVDDGPIRNIENAPPWAVPDFQVLLFVVAGLKMAVPLNELNGIVEWGDEYITELPGHKSWYLGIIQNQGKNIPVIDTLQQVVPQNRWPARHLQEKNFKHIILIDNSHWGLACEMVLEVVTLKTDSVKWRSSRTRRRWLLGTVIEHMCALLDGSEFAAMLKTGDDSLVSE